MFRAVPKDPSAKGESVVGTYFRLDSDTNSCFGQGPITEKHYLNVWIPGDWDLGRWCQIEVDPGTLVSGTGQMIQAGPPGTYAGTVQTELFEGDLVQKWGSKSVWILVWDAPELRFKYVLYWGGHDVDLNQDLTDPDLYKIGQDIEYLKTYESEKYIKDQLSDSRYCLFLGTCEGQRF